MHIQIIKLKRNVDSLSDLVNAQQLYEVNLRKAINGEWDGKSDTARLDPNQIKKEAMNTYPTVKK
jgi:hypothetical protein